MTVRRAIIEGSLRVVALAAFAVSVAAPAVAQESTTFQLDPFARATSARTDCSDAKPPILTEQQMRIQAHERAERGTSCCLAGTCECGGAYKRDPEINERVVIAIQRDARFRDTSVWVTTMRKFVTLQGCVRSSAQKSALERLVRRQKDVALVWNETVVKREPRPRTSK